MARDELPSREQNDKTYSEFSENISILLPQDYYNKCLRLWSLFIYDYLLSIMIIYYYRV